VFALYEGLIRELRSGGYVLYMHHGPTKPGAVDQKGPGSWWLDCQRTKGLSQEATLLSSNIANALVRQRIPVSEVLTSEFCRAYEAAAQLGLAAPVRTTALNDPSTQPAQAAEKFVAGVRELLSRPTQPKSNRVLVGHSLPGQFAPHPALSQLTENQVAIFRPEGAGRFHHIATLSPSQWHWVGRQTVADPPVLTAATPAPPLIDPSKELRGPALLQALRKGGFNLYMRHAQSNVGQDGSLLQTPSWWENCTLQRNISEPGKEQARKVGAAIRSLQIPIRNVVAAQFCRTRDTAHLMGFGPIEVSEDMNHMIGQRVGFDVNAARYKRLATVPAPGGNTLLVSHTHGSPRPEERVMGGIQEAEIVVFQPDGRGSSEPVARIPVAEWETLARLAESTKQ